MGPDVCKGIRGMVALGHILRKINYTHVTLIPKVKEATKMTQLRPISLCNVLYKIMAKVLANRLKVILPQIILPAQIAFIRERLISDNYLAVAEVAHYMHKRSSGLNGLMALKLDISKVYDRLEWKFLKAIMERMGFSQSWIHTIMLCVSTVTFSFKLNSEPVGYVHLGRGVRQGDPISPICLSCVLKVY